MKPYSFLLAFSLTLVCANARCEIPTLKDLPTSNYELGDVFVEAWLSFRTDLDTAAHGGVHPALLDMWMKEAPIFLAADAARLSNEPSVLLSAGQRLASIHGTEVLSILALVEKKNSKDPIAFAYSALRVRAGDEDAARRARDMLRSETSRTRLEGAKILCLAGRKQGVEHLRTVLRKGGDEAQHAARVLGRYGPSSTRKDLEAALRDNPDQPVVRAALGELFLRRTFPHHHDMMLRRDPTGQSFSVDDGLYEEWLKAAALADDAGIGTSARMLEFIDTTRREAMKGDRGEVLRRRLKSFMEFWSQVDAMMTRTDKAPPWPGTFQEALAALRKNSPAPTKSARFAARFSAAISICKQAGKRLGHSVVIGDAIRPIPLAPGAKRALDGNLATSWAGKKGMGIALGLENGTKVSEIRIANFCPKSKGRKVTRIEVSSGGPEPWTKRFRLKAASEYYEKVTLPSPAAKRLTVRVIETAGDQPACVSEIILK